MASLPNHFDHILDMVVLLPDKVCAGGERENGNRVPG